MHWPNRRVESIPANEFKPEHCPWELCPSNASADPVAFHYHLHGSFTRLHDPVPVPRFLCLVCERTFSRQTFACPYYLKRPALSSSIAAALVAGSAHRQIARSLQQEFQGWRSRLCGSCSPAAA